MTGRFIPQDPQPDFEIGSTSAIDLTVPEAIGFTITDDTLSVELQDGRTLSVPLEWYPRLVHATAEERNRWRLIAQGHGSVEGLIAGKPSGESQASFKRWLAERQGSEKYQG